ncbi:PfkB family carbohydrate kinase [Ichthyobacterium seriolicida]|uniref:Ribokinase n=1 Tax=Ichthyobacterium seriolicida TaxID=242600 RepID=A0A1J1EBV5_9FLAO|nr:PfkB family carbohydrate kinase [Ichthyobacterium seriolicida]BAV94992.1 ribokinase [Ichthyobacterium seriolicida]
MKLLVLGTVAYDAIETPFGKTDKILGGAGTYIALSASYLDESVGIISIVGNDFEDECLDLLKDHNIDISGIEIKKDDKTFFWSGRYSQDMNVRDTINTELNVLSNFSPVLSDKDKEVDFLMLGNLHPSTQLSVLKQLNKRPKIVALDTMNFWMDSALDELLNVLKEVDVLTINDQEARQLSGEYSLKLASRKILEMGPKVLIIKKGEHGAIMFGEDKMFYGPAIPLDIVNDPTGAGDSFAGGFMGYLAKTGDCSFENMKRALIYGSVMASFCIEEMGTKRLEYLSKKDISDRLQDFINLSKVDIN